MRAAVVVFVTVFRAQHFCFQQGREAFHVEELVTEPRVEALNVAVLPWRTGFDEKGSEPFFRDPVVHGSGHELRSVVRTDEVRNAVHLNQSIEGLDDVGARHRVRHLQRQALAGELVEHWKPLEAASRFGPVEHKIVAPDVIDPLGLQALRACPRVLQARRSLNSRRWHTVATASRLRAGTAIFPPQLPSVWPCRVPCRPPASSGGCSPSQVP